MRTNDASNSAGAQPLLLAAAAVLAEFAAIVFLLHPPAVHAAATSGAMVSTSKTSLGTILVESRGRTLYLFEKDRNGKSACAGKCASFWPPLITSGKPRAAGKAKASLIGTTKRADGRLQVTYKHHPLYTFARTRRRVRRTARGSMPSEPIGTWFRRPATRS